MRQPDAIGLQRAGIEVVQVGVAARVSGASSASRAATLLRYQELGSGDAAVPPAIDRPALILTTSFSS
jgi:hypothetical protein